MIYALDKDKYPSKGQYLEELIYRDENDFEWRIARVKSGFFIRYFGDPYFLDTTFEIEVNGGYKRVKNTNCIYIDNADFDTFCHFREIIKEGYTDDIQECFTEFFTERFQHSHGMLSSEIVH